ncbi:MAG: beta/gamma crystallin family protein [Pseudomonadota bacterium]|nr:beta/gamma crystallin family protein [Pseudomonadota bacterium]
MTECKTLLGGLVGVLLALCVPVAQAGEITLYEHPDFRGDSLTLHRGAPNLERSGLNDRISSLIVRAGVWEVCSDAFFRGSCAQLRPGEYRRLDGPLSDRISSVREIVTPAEVAPPIVLASAEPRIALFELPGFRGGAIELTQTNGKLDRIPAYAGADAVIVYAGTWRLCSREYYRGECFDFVPGRYENLGLLTGRVRSAELVAITGAPVGVAPPVVGAGRAVLYEYPNFRGESFAIDRRELANLDRMGFGDRAASMRIEEGYWMFCTDAQFQGDCRTLGPGEYARLPRDVDRRIASVRRVNDIYGAASTSYRHLR